MAASTSRQPYQVPLPLSAQKSVKSGKKTTSRKGKGKENDPTEPRAVSDVSWDAPESVWEWMSLTDPSASNVPPIFTKDRRYFFSLVGPSVKIHSVATGQVISTLSTPRSTNNIMSPGTLTSAILNPHNAFQLITGSLDGRLVVWDFLDGVLLKVIDIEQPIHYICAHELWRDTVFVAASRNNKKSKSGIDDNAAVLRVSLKPLGQTSNSAEVLAIGKTRFPTGLALSPSGTWLIATASHKAYVAATSSLTSGFTKYISPERLTCLSIHPNEEYFATGDDKGVVRLWYCLNDKLPVHIRGVEKKAQTTTLHWHAHAVSSIAFTSNGAYLLTGGEESVLVIWQLHTGKKEFVPRVGAPINSIAVLKGNIGEEEYLLGLSDATYLFISSGNLKPSRSYSRIKLDPTFTHRPTSKHIFHPPLAIHSLTSTLILPSSHPSSLQLYSPMSSKLVSELEVSPSNRISRRDEKPVVPSYVNGAVVSPSGEWLATVDVRETDEGFRDEIYLKIWLWDQEGSRWALNTRVDRPHELKMITCMVFAPFSKHFKNRLVTTGGDGSVKIWGPKVAKHKSGVVEEFWVTRSTFAFRSEIPQSASWSQDSSLLAIVFGPYVVLFDSNTSASCETLSLPGGKAGKSAHFIGEEGRYLAIVGEFDVTLWDLISHSVRWTYTGLLIIDMVIPHTEGDSFAVFHDSSSPETCKTRVSIFHAPSPTPSSTHCVPFRLRNILQYSLSTMAQEFVFIGITDDWRVVIFGDGVQLAQGVQSMATEIIHNPAPLGRTLFQDIFGKSAFAEEIPSISVNDVGPAVQCHEKVATDVFSIPMHLMPAFEHFFEPLMYEHLRFRPHSSPVETTEEDDDVDMEEDNTDTSLVGSSPKRVVTNGEMDTFILLFKKYIVECPPTVSSTNGHSTIASATAKAKATTTSNLQSESIRVLKPITTHWREQPAVGPGDDDASPSTSTPLTNGKKRKKSLGWPSI